MTGSEIDKDKYFNDLREIFSAMASGYEAIANHYGFDCKGCEDSCCLTLFYHHTLIEYLYLKEGMKTLSQDERKDAELRAETQIEALKNHNPDESFRKMCPLNKDGLCILYEYRPMICRLHGVCHELRKSGQEPLRGPGCENFKGFEENKEYFPLDRTPYYIEMANLERKLRMETGNNRRLKMTIAEIILD